MCSFMYRVPRKYEHLLYTWTVLCTNIPINAGGQEHTHRVFLSQVDDILCIIPQGHCCVDTDKTINYGKLQIEKKNNILNIWPLGQLVVMVP